MSIQRRIQKGKTGSSNVDSIFTKTINMPNFPHTSRATNFKMKNNWQSLTDITVLVPSSPDEFYRMHHDGYQFKSLPELFKLYIANPHIFDKRDRENIQILTDTNEIMGVDLEGKIYSKNEKIIIHTHGLFIHSKSNSESLIDANTLSQEEFTNLLSGKINSGKNLKNVKVYREEELKKIKSKIARIDYPCITILHGEKYLDDPDRFCNNLEYTSRIYGLDDNYLLSSRTLQEPAKLMNFLQEKVTYLRQTAPLLEPLILYKSLETLFTKYANRVMPLVLSDGQITKYSRDSNVLFYEKSDCENFASTLSTLNIRN